MADSHTGRGPHPRDVGRQASSFDFGPELDWVDIRSLLNAAQLRASVHGLPILPGGAVQPSLGLSVVPINLSDNGAEIPSQASIFRHEKWCAPTRAYMNGVAVQELHGSAASMPTWRSREKNPVSPDLFAVSDV